MAKYLLEILITLKQGMKSGELYTFSENIEVVPFKWKTIFGRFVPKNKFWKHFNVFSLELQF